MRTFKKVLIFGWIGILLMACQQDIPLKPVQIIPQPNSIVESQEPPFVLSNGARIIIEDDSMLPVAYALQRVLKSELPVVVRSETDISDGDFSFTYDDSLSPKKKEKQLVNSKKRMKISCTSN